MTESQPDEHDDIDTAPLFGVADDGTVIDADVIQEQLEQ